MSPSPLPFLASVQRPLRVLWLQSGGCGGCSMSLLCADTPDLQASLADAGIELLWHPSLSLQTGHELLELLQDCLSGKQTLDVLCLEGAVLRGPHGSGRFHVLAGTGRPMLQWVTELAQVARVTVAVGSCAAWGGITAGGQNPTDAVGLQFEGSKPGGALGAAWRSPSGLPVVNIAGCPTHPEWVTETLALLAAGVLDAGCAGRTRTPALLRRSSGAPRLHAQRVLRVQGQRRKALGPGLHDGAHGLQGHPGPRRLQYTPVERRRLLHPRWLRLHQLHRARLREPRPPLPHDARRSPASLSACPPTCPRPGSLRWLRLSKSATPCARASQRHRRPPGGGAGDQEDHPQTMTPRHE